MKDRLLDFDTIATADDPKKLQKPITINCNFLTYFCI